MTAPHDKQASAAVTRLLSRARQGDSTATNELFPLVYEELRVLAAKHMAGERREHTLSPTSLVHEAYLRLVGPSATSWDNRAHFFGAAAIAIRRILTDHARSRARDKRGGGASLVRLEGDSLAGDAETIDHASLDDALTKLATLDPQKARIVELRYYVGLPVEQVAQAMGVSQSTIAREWAFARTWLRRELSHSEDR
ncbi:MAG: sigma-70 family RNA polymerase sigma factor [Phycisphaerales bacterium]